MMMEGKRKNEKGKTERVAAALLFSFFLFPFSVQCGCVHHPPPAKPAYTGPTEPMYDVVKAINANNSKLPTLWASMKHNGLEASIVDDNGKRHDEVLDGALFYRAPMDVSLRGHHELAGDV